MVVPQNKKLDFCVTNFPGSFFLMSQKIKNGATDDDWDALQLPPTLTCVAFLSIFQS
jgi:hypothetical protein